MIAVSNDLPMISIVTPTLNRAGMIRAAIESVLQQGYPNVEHIVVDGRSTDGTAAVLADYPHLRIICEPDRGVYDGLNKGIRLARGEVIGHLNSDDIYAPGALLAVARQFQQDTELDVVSGNATISIAMTDGSRRVIKRYEAPADRTLTFATGTIGAPLINARFFRRRLYDRVGLYDSSYAISGDRDFLIRAVLVKPKQIGIDMVVYDYLSHDNSLTLDNGASTFIPIYSELLHLARHYAADPASPIELRRCCVKFQRESVSRACIEQLRNKNWSQFADIFWRGLRSDPVWPLCFAGLVLRRGVRLRNA